MYQLRHTVVMCGFQCLHYQSVFQKKEALLMRASDLCCFIVNLNLVGLCDRSVGLHTKCALVKLSENVKEHEPLLQALVKIINTKKRKLLLSVSPNTVEG